MKISLRFLLFVLSIGIIIACTRKKPEPITFANPESIVILSDSINILDSLVNTIKISDNHRAHHYATRALSLAMTINSEEALARAFLMIGIAYKNFDDDSSFIYYTNALRIANKNDLVRIKPKIYYNMAMIYYAASDSRTAILYLDSSIIAAQRVKDHVWMSNAYNVLGNVQFDMLDSVDARAMFDSAFTIARRHALARQMGISMASLSRFENNPAASSGIRKQAIEILQKQAGNEEEIAQIFINLGTRCSNVDTAIRYYQSAINIAKLANSTEIEIAAYNNLAYSFMEKMNFRIAEECLGNYAIPLAEKNQNYDWLSTLYDSYSEILASENNIGKALLYERKALTFRTEADKKQAAGQVRLLAALLNVKNRELRIQTNEKDLQQKENKIHKMYNWFAIAFSGFLLVTLFIMWMLLKNKIKYQKDLISSAKRLIESEEKLKGRVSMELHDIATPFYTTMMQQIEEAHIKDPKIKNGLKNKLSTMTSGVRQISHRMNNSFLGQLSINEHVTGLCKDLKEITRIPIHCLIGEEEFHLSLEETIHIYRIIQELMTNAIKHVNFGEITISLAEEAGKFCIRYHDTGPGFDVKESTNKGLGIMNIFERAKIIHGKAELTTLPGKGTKWNIIIPVDHDKKQVP
jgi:signal transduction histidine kinase